MKRVLRWGAIGLAGLVVLVLIAACTLWIRSLMIRRHTYTLALEPFRVPTDSASIAAGERLATIHGCYHGCHGTQMQGDSVFINEPMLAVVGTPNLTRAVREYSNGELERVIRHGVRRNGRSVFVMPSQTLARLTNDDLGRILAFIRSKPEREGPAFRMRLGPLGILGVATGQFPAAAKVIPPNTQHIAPDLSQPAALGDYLVHTICSECHGQDLRGNAQFPSPSLALASTYPLEDFRAFMRTGIAAGGRELKTMTPEAKQNLSALTNAEIDAIYGYLRSITGALARMAQR